MQLDAARRSPREVTTQAYRASLVVAAVPVSWFAVAHDPAPGRGSWALFVGLAVALAVVRLSPVRLGTGGHAPFELTDAVVLTAVALEGTGVALLTAVALRAAATSLAGRGRWALVSDVGEQAIGTSVAALVVGQVGVGGSPSSLAAALVVAGVAFFGVRLSAAAALSAVDQRGGRLGVRPSALIDLGMYAGAVCTAVVVVLLGTAAPWAMPFSVGPLVLVAMASRLQQEARRDKARLYGLVAASAGIQRAPTTADVASTALAAARHVVSPAARLAEARPKGVLAAAVGSERRAWLVADRALDADGADLFRTIASVASLAWDKAELADRARHEALHDGLTGLGNMSLLTGVFGAALRARDPEAAGGAVLFVGLDRFKAVNDELGHDAGDRLLQAVAHRLRASVRGGDVVGRLGGDEFVVLCPGGGRIVALQLADRIQRELARPFRIGSRVVEIGGSVGNGCWPDDGQDFADLLRVAETSMYSSKRSRRTRSKIG